ncbi:ImmA/IrrE family metallo-endopeptidase [Janthinobacterium sp. 75]|uniref:ImmA/IrrE family metallo-endopeptidase n=1 Tax=Janthinobacterium sp. 75 TaxID=2135628 RepID=UPI0010642215|nr:ImmA/IrrE family metallo-endopeptidase [Janthinobacterium sp. 75]
MIDRWPEVAIARLIAERHGFTPGESLLDLVSVYADVDFLPIPVQQVDGVSLHLKAKLRRPSIIVNSQIAATRAKFTLAHEFGHVLIPWHSGTIFSYSDSVKHTEDADNAYWEMEAEANRFAAELLMPRDWLRDQILTQKDPTSVIRMTLDLCGTSMAAATIALNNALPPGYVYARTNDEGLVATSISSQGTLVRPFAQGEKFAGSVRVEESSACYSMDFKGTHHWLYFGEENVPDQIADERPWREIFDEIIQDTDAIAIQENIKHSVNAIISACNKKDTSAALFFTNVRHRMAGRTEVYDKILTHPLFNVFLQKKVSDLISRRA